MTHQDSDLEQSPTTAPVAKRPLGRTGRSVSELGLGCASFWARPSFPERRAREVFDTALACGITLFDTGGSYAGGAAEQRLGRFVKASGRDCAELVIATKAGTRADPNGGIRRDFSPAGIVEQVDHSLKRLALERISLLQLHGPQADDLSDELLGTLVRLRDAGKIEMIGINAHAEVLEKTVGKEPFDVLMPFVSILNPRNTGLARRAEKAGQGVLAAEPLGRMQFAPPLHKWLLSSSGLWYLARALSQRGTKAERRCRKCLRKALVAPGWSRAQLALSWVLTRQGVNCAVFGTTRPEHVLELARACTQPLPDAVADAIAACHRQRQSPGTWA